MYQGVLMYHKKICLSKFPEKHNFLCHTYMTDMALLDMPSQSYMSDASILLSWTNYQRNKNVFRPFYMDGIISYWSNRDTYKNSIAPSIRSRWHTWWQIGKNWPAVRCTIKKCLFLAKIMQSCSLKRQACLPPVYI